MKKNLGQVDRAIRIMIALMVVGLYIPGILSGTFGIVMMILAVIFAVTGMISFCPMYYVFGLRSNKELTPSRVKVD